MSIQARWSGTCPECGERWQPGDLIRSDDRDPDGPPIWTHAVCPDVPDPDSLRPGETVCHRLLAGASEGGRVLVTLADLYDRDEIRRREDRP